MTSGFLIVFNHLLYFFFNTRDLGSNKNQSLHYLFHSNNQQFTYVYKIQKTNVQTTFDTYNVIKRGETAKFQLDYNITLSNQLYYTIYLFQNNIAFFPQIFKGRFLCLLSSRSDNSPKTLPRLFPANESPSHSSCSSNQYIMATSSYMSFLFSNTLTMLFKHSTMVFTHTQLNGNLSGNSYLFTQLIPELPIFVSHRSALLPPK